MSDKIDKSATKVSKVLLIAPQPFFANRGTPFNVKAMATGLAELGYTVDLLVYPFGEQTELPESVRVIRSPKAPFVSHVPIGPSWQKFPLDFLMIFTAIRLLIQNRYCVIHGVEEGGVIAGLLAKLCKKPYVFDMDSCMVEQLETSGFFRWKPLLNIVSWLERFFISNSNAVLTVCEALTQKARQISDSAKIYQIEDYPLESSYQVSDDVVEKIKTEFDLHNRQTIVYTGNFENYQGIELLLESMSVLKKDYDEVDMPNLLLVGGGNPGSKYRDHYEEMVYDLGLEDCVTFAGLRPPEQMGSFMAIGQILVSPRITGGNTPLKIYSYMAAARAVVATKISSHTQVLNEENAFLAEPNPRDFAKVLREALNDRESRKQRATVAKELVENKYSRKEFVRRLGEMYNAI